ncbi:MAG TPA: TetR/AcrR family transcriptional regulator [Candidatus Dormibacteraeota bacterium]|nr:TetR/AcrR family transcriptional regulator [Candidatus Dormibacteraeota bacterium]
MARTLNVEVHTVRREVFVDAATRLMQVKGWEQTSVQDLLDATEASRGAFYHYFDSKQSLLEAVIERMVDAGLGAVAPVVESHELAAAPKLKALFGGIARWKSAQKALVLALLQTWLSDDNAVVREKFRHRLAPRLTPMLAKIIAQGIKEGMFKVTSSEDTARIFVTLLLGFQDIATDLFIARQTGAIGYEAVRDTVVSFNDAFERILGAPRGSIDLADEAVLQEWFG